MKSEELLNIRSEITERVKILHAQLSLATVLLASLGSMYFILLGFGLDKDSLQLFVLLIPLIISLLGYNYQANQMTLEALARYADSLAEKDKPSTWDKFYGKHKRKHELTSFLKVFPLLLPQLIPLSLLYFDGWVDLTPAAQGLLILDTILFITLIYNFKYKSRG